MKQTRFLAAATAATVALTTVVPAHAAQIGPLDQNRCKVTFTAAERAYIDKLDTELDNTLTGGFFRDFAISLENTFPGIREVGNDFVDAHQHHLTNHRTEEAFDSAFNALDLRSYKARLQAVGLTQEGAEAYLESRAIAAYGSHLMFSDNSPSTDYGNFYADAEYFDGDYDINTVGFLLLILLGIGDVIQTEDQMAKFYKTFENTASGKKVSEANAFIRSHFEAQRVCVGGGNGTVAYPTGKSTSEPSNAKPSNPAPSKPSGNQQPPAKPSTDTQGTTDQGANDNAAADEQGSSTAGIVIGVIAAILAVIGIAAVAAPQLGLQIPGLG